MYCTVQLSFISVASLQQEGNQDPRPVYYGVFSMDEKPLAMADGKPITCLCLLFYFSPKNIVILIRVFFVLTFCLYYKVYEILHKFKILPLSILLFTERDICTTKNTSKAVGFVDSGQDHTPWFFFLYIRVQSYRAITPKNTLGHNSC